MGCGCERKSYFEVPTSAQTQQTQQQSFMPVTTPMANQSQSQSFAPAFAPAFSTEQKRTRFYPSSSISPSFATFERDILSSNQLVSSNIKSYVANRVATSCKSTPRFAGSVANLFTTDGKPVQYNILAGSPNSMFFSFRFSAIPTGSCLYAQLLELYGEGVPVILTPATITKLNQFLFGVLLVTTETVVNDTVIAGEIASACLASSLCELAIINDNKCDTAPATLYSLDTIVKNIIVTRPDGCNTCDTPLQGFVKIDTSFGLIGQTVFVTDFLSGKSKLINDPNTLLTGCESVVNNVLVSNTIRVIIAGSKRSEAWKVLLCSIGCAIRNQCTGELISTISTPTSIDMTGCCETECLICALCDSQNVNDAQVASIVAAPTVAAGGAGAAAAPTVA